MTLTDTTAPDSDPLRPPSVPPLILPLRAQRHQQRRHQSGLGNWSMALMHTSPWRVGWYQWRSDPRTVLLALACVVFLLLLMSARPPRPPLVVMSAAPPPPPPITRTTLPTAIVDATPSTPLQAPIQAPQAVVPESTPRRAPPPLAATHSEPWPRPCRPWVSPASQRAQPGRHDPRRWVFCHMPKTAGMSTRAVLERAARADGQRVAALNRNYETPRCAAGDEPRCGPGGILGTQRLEDQLPAAFGAQYAPHVTRFTMLRDPIDRAYSAYHYVLRETNKPVHALYKANTLEALLRSRQFYTDDGLGANAYTRVLSDMMPAAEVARCLQLRNQTHHGARSDRLEGDAYWDCRLDLAKRALSPRYMDLVCLTERYDQCMAVLSGELFPDWLTAERVAAIPHRNAAPRPHLRSPSVDAMLRAANAHDLELYAFAQAQFGCRWQRFLASARGGNSTQFADAYHELWAWGTNDHGQLGLANSTTPATAQIAPSEARRVPPPEGLDRWPALVRVGGGGGVWDWAARSRADCGSYSLALAANGSLYSAGWNRWGLLGPGRGPTQLDRPRFGRVLFDNVVGDGGRVEESRVVDFAAGHRHVLALLEPGARVVAWGHGSYGQVADADGATNGTVQVGAGADPVVQLAAGGRHSLALTDSGRVWAWGLNERALLGLGPTGTDAQQRHVREPRWVERLWREGGPAHRVCAGARHSAALMRRTAAVWEWGWAPCATQGMRLCKGHLFRQVPFAAGSSSGTPTIETLVDLSCGGGATFALGAHGGLYAWGTNEVGELGLGPGASSWVHDPVRVENLPPLATAPWPSYDYVPDLHGGATLALAADGTSLWTWGPGTKAPGREGSESEGLPESERCRAPAVRTSRARCAEWLRNTSATPCRLAIQPIGTDAVITVAAAAQINRGVGFMVTR